MATITWDRPRRQAGAGAEAFTMPPKLLARVAGAIYLIIAVCGGFSELYVRSSVKAAGDAAVTAENIRAAASLFRLGFVTDLVQIACFSLLALALYVLLSPVSRKIAASFVIFNAIAVAIMGVNTVNHVGALVVATDPAYAAALGSRPADALALLFLNLHGHGFQIAQIFFGLWLLPLGYLVYTSGYFPRVLGIMLMIGCFGYLAHLVAVYAAPDFESSASLYLALLAGITETSFLLWLLVKGANVPPRVEPAPAAS